MAYLFSGGNDRWTMACGRLLKGAINTSLTQRPLVIDTQPAVTFGSLIIIDKSPEEHAPLAFCCRTSPPVFALETREIFAALLAPAIRTSKLFLTIWKKLCRLLGSYGKLENTENTNSAIFYTTLRGTGSPLKCYNSLFINRFRLALLSLNLISRFTGNFTEI